MEPNRKADGDYVSCEFANLDARRNEFLFCFESCFKSRLVT